MLFSDSILDFINNLSLDSKTLPDGVEVMNPYQDGEGTALIRDIAQRFYTKFYSDQEQRRMIIGINPGRLGAGSTGIPFTDTKRLAQHADIDGLPFSTHEPSSVFVYEMIEAYGGAEAFYKDYYITSACPLGFLKQNARGNWVNYNYYDSKALEKAVKPYIIETIREQLEFGIDRQMAICWGTGKNFAFLNKLNKEEKFFEEIVPLEHPRYIIQYKSKHKASYIDKYMGVLEWER